MTAQPKLIGIVGGGQLGRMLTMAALPLGFRVIVIDPGENCPAAQVGAEQIVADFYDGVAIRELSERADFITVETEHVGADTLQALASQGATVNPAPETIRLIQDKLAQKQFLAGAGVPVAPFAELTSYENGLKILERFNGKMLVKTRFGAYDGRGNMIVDSAAQLKQAFKAFDRQPLYAEEFVPFQKELAVMVARGLDGTAAAYPVVETIHERNICVEVLAPAEVTQGVRAQAGSVAKKVAQLLDGAGMFGVEMFLAKSGEILVNEVAPRVHNSGHWTMNGARTSQFEQHIRAITGLPLGDTSMSAPACVMVNILGESDHPNNITGLDAALDIGGVSIQLYGKSPVKIDRKMGHINAIGETVEQAQIHARKARKAISI